MNSLDSMMTASQAAELQEFIRVLKGIASPWATTEEAAEYVRYGRKIITDAVARGELKAHRPRGEDRFHKAELDDWVRGKNRDKAEAKARRNGAMQTLEEHE